MQIEEAISKLARLDMVKDTEVLDITDALGRVLAEDISSPYDLPFFDRSPLDGFAIRGEDSGDGVKLQVIEEIHAGQVASKKLGPNQAIRIMTGAKMPEGANTVCRLEDVVIKEDEIILDRKYEPYSNYIFKGEEVKKDELIMKKNEELNAIRIGTLANLGIPRVKVYRLPKIAIISTGSELVAYDQDLEEGKIFNSNNITLSQRLKELRLEASFIGQIDDNLEELKKKFSTLGEEMDLVISTGGVAVGDADYMVEVLKSIGGEEIFSSIEMKPGGHVKAYQKDSCTFLALSGNPFAALATFEIFARHIISQLSGKDLYLRKREAICQNEFKKSSKTRRIIRAYYEDGKAYLPSDHESGNIYSAATCNALVDIPPGSNPLKIGDKLSLYLL